MVEMYTVQLIFIRGTDGTVYVNEDVVNLCSFEVARPDEVLFINLPA